MQIRTMYQPFLDRVNAYFTHALNIINQYQFTNSGGPVIAIQIENEYFGSAPTYIPIDLKYLQYLYNFTRASGFNGLLFTSDPVEFAQNFPVSQISGLLETANLNMDVLNQLMVMRKNMPGKPIYVSEFWPGWYDEWGNQQHHSYKLDLFEKQVSDILFRVRLFIS